MSNIAFSYPFPKLYGRDESPVTLCRLLQVIEVDLADLTQEFINYDTHDGTYQLPKRGKYLLLILQKPSGVDLFTTLRRSTPQKLEYYKRMVGEKLDVVLLENAAAV